MTTSMITIVVPTMVLVLSVVPLFVVRSLCSRRPRSGHGAWICGCSSGVGSTGSCAVGSYTSGIIITLEVPTSFCIMVTTTVTLFGIASIPASSISSNFVPIIVAIVSATSSTLPTSSASLSTSVSFLALCMMLRSSSGSIFAPIHNYHHIKINIAIITFSFFSIGMIYFLGTIGTIKVSICAIIHTMTCVIIWLAIITVTGNVTYKYHSSSSMIVIGIHLGRNIASFLFSPFIL
mmetsp:Transcript_29302/g.63072  ORF Transcript_29302/g.63072 Transcript_29302/m.63072 type:complete len:235 (-) Transcript_29302:323-1027(-)